jgi:hypothetical protein
MLYCLSMISILRRGEYKLIETKHDTRILILDDKERFAWITAENIGEILVTTHASHTEDNLLAVGKYRLYDVENEPKFTDQQHLELQVGCGYWQGYLLPNGLPTEEKIRNRIITTKELLTATNNCCHHTSGSH